MLEFMKLFISKYSLQTFGEGGAGGAGGDGGAGGSASAGADGAAPAEAGAKVGKAAAAAEDLSKVQYGVQDAGDEGKTEADAPKEEPKAEEPAKKQTFDELLKQDPEYQREMQKRIDQAINRRFAKSKAAEEQNAKLAPALNLLATKYGIEAGNTDALIEAINGDSELIEQQAMDAGMEPEAYREFQRLKAENEAMKQAAQERERNDQMRETMNKWERDAEALKLKFPNFDLHEEVKNEQFAQMLGAGVTMEAAYTVAHMDEIQRGLIQHAAADAKRQTVASIAAKQGRPRENGAAKTQAATVKMDPTKLTIRDFEEIDRRLARGETIRF